MPSSAATAAFPSRSTSERRRESPAHIGFGVSVFLHQLFGSVSTIRGERPYCQAPPPSRGRGEIPRTAHTRARQHVGTFRTSARRANSPFSSRYFTIFFADAALIPATWERSIYEAVLRSTPTALRSIRPRRRAPRQAAPPSCHADTVPRRSTSGSIFTSSASGCRRRAIDTAERCVTSKSGYPRRPPSMPSKPMLPPR